jgi:riboflavin kinase/FMN adenylyltransferase
MSTGLMESLAVESLPKAFTGTVVRGVGRGRTLGIPTANLDVPSQAELPYGVYAARISGDVLNYQMGVANIGTRPTFSERELSIELHILDFSGDIYGIELQVELIAFLRDEREFDTIEDLKQQIFNDIKQARKRLLSEN